MSKSEELKFKLFANCIPIRGYKRGIIYDLSRKLYKYIPNSMIDFLVDAEGKSRDEIKTIYSEEFYTIVEEYLVFLEINEFNFWIPQPLINNFSSLKLHWDYPAQASNAIIDLDINSDFNLVDIFEQLEALGCMHIQLRSFCKQEEQLYEQLLEALFTSSYLSIEIITKYNEEQKEEQIRRFAKHHNRVKAIIFHSAPLNKIYNDKGLHSMGNIAYTMQEIKSQSDCHNNNKDYFNVMMELFTESQNHHTYYNRKVSIDINGNIKNCTSHDKIFGNIKTDKIEDVIKKPEFQKLWFVTKDKMEGCKDCEFRNMCIDSRLPIEKKDGVWSFEKECNYNPYIAKWKGEDGYITFEELKKTNDFIYEN